MSGVDEHEAGIFAEEWDLAQAIDAAYDVYPRRLIFTAPDFCTARGCERKRTPLEVVLGVEPHPRPAVRPGDLCEVHVRQFRTLLDDLASDADDLEHGVVRRKVGPSGDPVVQTSGHSEVSELWNPSVAHVQDDLRGWLRSIVHTVLTDRGDLLQSGLDGSRDLDVRLTLRILARNHARWLALYPTLGPAWLDDAHQFRRRARTALGRRGVRRVGLPGHQCHAIVDYDDVIPVLCLGQLVAVLVEPGQDVTSSKILCQVNPSHTMPLADAVRIDLDPNAHVWVLIDVAAAALGLGIRRTREIAKEDGWRSSRPSASRDLGRPPRQYLWRDVVGTYYRRKEDG